MPGGFSAAQLAAADDVAGQLTAAAGTLAEASAGDDRPDIPQARMVEMILVVEQVAGQGLAEPHPVQSCALGKR